MDVIMSAKKRLIVFLVPPEKIVNGGVLSIFSICQVSRQFKSIHKSEVFLAVYPGHKSYKKNDLFDNEEVVYDFDEVVAMGKPESLLLHVPEYASFDVCNALKENYADYINSIRDFRVNIMLQNILLMQPPIEVAKWFALTTHLTQTTAHNRYSNQELAEKYAIPTHHFSTYLNKKQYKWTPYQKKEKLITISPDNNGLKEAVVSKIKDELPDYKTLVIKNLRYEDYKATISRAKFTITFGEGFDGYYLEGFFSGGITFAVYNDKFFPDKDFAGFRNTYASYEEMSAKIVEDIKALDTKSAYEKVVQQNLDKINQLYNFEKYQSNIENFYKGKFTYTPSMESIKKLLQEVLNDKLRIIADKDELLKERQKVINDLNKLVKEKDTAIEQLNQEIATILNSRSWKVTKPLRKISSATKPKR